jgi:hypothetical protein
MWGFVVLVGILGFVEIRADKDGHLEHERIQ